MKVDVEHLKEFNHLPYTIFDKHGMILFDKGDKLDHNILRTLTAEELYIVETKPTIMKKPPSQKIYTKGTIERLVDISLDIASKAKKGLGGSLDAIDAACIALVDDVTDNMNVINHIDDLRIKDVSYGMSHCINVSSVSTAIAYKLHFSKAEMNDLAKAAILHDVGKSLIPDQILNKPSKLTAKEYELAKLHAPLSYKILNENYKLSQNILLATLEHHERFDGSGYSRGLEENNINKFAQIIAIADVYDAITSNKPYSPAKTAKEAMRELLRKSREFNPRIVYTLVHMLNFNSGNKK